MSARVFSIWLLLAGGLGCEDDSAAPATGRLARDAGGDAGGGAGGGGRGGGGRRRRGCRPRRRP